MTTTHGILQPGDVNGEMDDVLPFSPNYFDTELVLALVGEDAAVFSD